MNILIIGSGAREHAIARAFHKSPQRPALFCFGSSVNPGIKNLCEDYATGTITDSQAIALCAKEKKISFAIVGPEAPLEAGVADELVQKGIPCVGPAKKLAQIETSKSFARDLLAEYNIPASPAYRYFTAMNGVESFIYELGGNYVIKADGLMGGKGVKVSGDHLNSISEGVMYCQELINSGKTFVIEEKLLGQEFSLMSFTDGEHLAHMPPVQDHKRAFVNDEGPNTGGMGSYSDADHLLPFLTKDDVLSAREINRQTMLALKDKFGVLYKGILYGGFMLTKDGVKLIEYNARLGDPEAMNVLSLLNSDFVALCQAIIGGTLSPTYGQFAEKATVCKYAVPNGYPQNPVKNEKIDISQIEYSDQLYLSAVDQREDGLYETGSRTAAVVGIADTLKDAEKMAEKEINKIKGPLFHREDIGTEALIQKRVEMMKQIRNPA